MKKKQAQLALAFQETKGDLYTKAGKDALNLQADLFKVMFEVNHAAVWQSA